MLVVALSAAANGVLVILHSDTALVGQGAKAVAKAAENTKKDTEGLEFCQKKGLSGSESDITRKTDSGEIRTDEFVNTKITAESAPETLETQTTEGLRAAAEVPNVSAEEGVTSEVDAPIAEVKVIEVAKAGTIAFEEDQVAQM